MRWQPGWAAPARPRRRALARDDAGGYTAATNNSSWLCGTTTNGGFGFYPWVFRTLEGTDCPPEKQIPTNYLGYFIGDAGAIGSTNGAGWGMYAHGDSSNNLVVAYRDFTNTLNINTIFRIKWLSDGIGFKPSNAAGFSLGYDRNTSSATNYIGNEAFGFFYRGGGVDGVRFGVWSGEHVEFYADPPIPFSALNRGVTVEFVWLAVVPGVFDGYLSRLIVRDAVSQRRLATYDMVLYGCIPCINSLALYASQTDGHQLFNDVAIYSTSLAAPEFKDVQPEDKASFLDPATAYISFTVFSDYTAIATNEIALTLNGVARTSLSFTGMATNWVVTDNSPLEDNQSYTAVITVQDTNGNRATNTFTFNTWHPTNPAMEGEDYNFASGGFFLGTSQHSPGGYASPPGINGVDFLESDLAGTNNVYRPDLPQVELAYDLDHGGYAEQWLTDFNLGWIQNGEWEDYTRILDDQTYAIYARMAGFGGNPVMLLEHLIEPTATTSDQARVTLGTFHCPSDTGGFQSYVFVLLADSLGHLVLVRFPGTNTFRCTCIGNSGSYNLNYLFLVPVTNAPTLRPYLSAAVPPPNATNVGTDAGISFTIANRQTAVTPGSLQLYLNGDDLTAGNVVASTSAGTSVTNTRPWPLPTGINSVQVGFSDSEGVWQTNQWQFTVPLRTNAPPEIVNVQPADRANFLSAPATQISFEVLSRYGSGVPSGWITAALNGMAWRRPASLSPARPTIGT